MGTAMRIPVAVWCLIWWACGPTSDEAQVPEVVDIERPVEEASELPPSAASDSEEVASLKAQIVVLEERIRELEGEKEQAATQDEESNVIFKDMKKAYKTGDYAQAKVLVARLEQDFAGSTGHEKSKKYASELSLFGQSAPSHPAESVVGWIHAQPSGDVATALDWSKGAHLLIFWEHSHEASRNHLMAFRDRSGPWLERGLQVLSLTRLTKGSTADQVVDFLDDQSWDLPVVRENGALKRAFKVAALPAAVLIQDGVIVWRGDLKKLTDTALRTLWQD